MRPTPPTTPGPGRQHQSSSSLLPPGQDVQDGLREWADREVTARQAAELIRKGERTVRRWIKDGRLPARHIASNRYAIKVADLSRFMVRDETGEVLRNLRQIQDEL